MTLDNCKLYFNERLDCMPLHSGQRDMLRLAFNRTVKAAMDFGYRDGIGDVEKLVSGLGTGSEEDSKKLMHHPV